MSETEEKKPEAPAEEPAKAEGEKKEEKVQALEVYFREHGKDGDYFFKRRNGKARLRMISLRKNQAKLFYMVKNEWVQKTAIPKGGGRPHGLAWHERNKWLRIQKKDLPVAKAAK